MAYEVIRQYDITIPIVDIDDVVRKIGGCVLENHAIDEFSDGKIRKTGSHTFSIEIPPYQTPERRNFTVAHELGHLFLHMGFATNEERWNSWANDVYYQNDALDAEYQANEFAAALLMPEDEYVRIMRKHTEGSIVKTSEIARYFRVLLDVAANRGKTLGYLKSW